MNKDLNEDDDNINIIPPDYSLKKALGDDVDLRVLFNDEVIKQAQSNIIRHQENYLKWFGEDLDMLEHHYTLLSNHPADAAVNAERLHVIAISIKSQGGTFGFDLASEVARSLYLFLHDFSYSLNNCIVVRKHIDALRVILDLRIAGAGGDAGQELMNDIAKLTAKFKK